MRRIHSRGLSVVGKNVCLPCDRYRDLRVVGACVCLFWTMGQVHTRNLRTFCTRRLIAVCTYAFFVYMTVS